MAGGHSFQSECDEAENQEIIKFGLNRDQIRSQLNRDYNTMSFNVLDGETFLQDTLEMLDNGVNPLDFYRALGAKRERHLHDLSQRFEYLGRYTFLRPEFFEPDPGRAKCRAAGQCFRQQSFASLVNFFSTMMPGVDERRPQNINAFDGLPDQRQQQRAPPAHVYKQDEVPTTAEMNIWPPPTAVKPRCSRETTEHLPPRRSERLGKKPARQYKVTKPTRHKQLGVSADLIKWLKDTS